MNSFDMAKALVGSSSRTSNTASHKASQTTTIFGTATSDSEDGKVRVLFDGDSTGTDEDGSIEVSTTFSIKEGDTVIVSLIGADGTGKYPIVVGVEGRGDEIVESISGTATALANYILSNDEALENLQSQIDGAINTWFYAYEPTLQNEPANEWSTATEKNNHLGDLFYNTQTGYCYRFAYTNEAYIWLRVTDTDIATALANAAQAQETADGKATIFTGSTTPTDAQEGDVWFKGANEGIYTYVNNAWIEYNKYTDDTAANAAQETADDAEAHAQTALTNAATANSTANTANTKANNAIVSQTNYYILSASTPATPTEASHSGWSATEPAWSATSTDKLYISTRTAYGSGTVTWSAPAEVQAYANINVAKNAIELSVSETYVTNSDLEDTLDDYSTTTQMNSAIQQSASSITSTVSATYATKTELGDYSTTTQMNSAIQQSASSITSTVSATYATKTELSETDTKADNAQTAADNAQTTADNAQAEAENKVDIGDSNIEELSSTMKQDSTGVNIYNDISTVDSTYAHIDNNSFDIKTVSTAGLLDNINDKTIASFGREVTVGSRDSSGSVGNYSQVFGQKCVASAPYSRANGFNTIAASAYQSVSGRNNAEDDTGTYAEIVGNGEYPSETEEFMTDGETISWELSHAPFTVNNFLFQSDNAIEQYITDINFRFTKKYERNHYTGGVAGILSQSYIDVVFSRSFDYDIEFSIIPSRLNNTSITGISITIEDPSSSAYSSTHIIMSSNKYPNLVLKSGQTTATYTDGYVSSYPYYSDGTIGNGYRYRQLNISCRISNYSITASLSSLYSGSAASSKTLTLTHNDYDVISPNNLLYSYALGNSSDFTISNRILTLTGNNLYWAQTISGLTITIDYEYEGTTIRSNARTLDWDGNEKLAGEIDAAIRTATVDGYSGALHLYRFGRVVFLSTNDFKSKSSSVASGTVLTQIIPVGFRPISIAVAPKPIATSTNNAFFEFGTDGSITYKGSTGWANATAWSTTWITGDD